MIIRCCLHINVLRYQVCLQSRTLSLDNADITEAALRPPHTCVRTFVVRPRRVRLPRSGFKLDRHHHLSLVFSVSSATTSSMSTRTLSRLVGSNLRSATSRAPRTALRVRCMASAADSTVCHFSDCSYRYALIVFDAVFTAGKNRSLRLSCS